MESEDYLHAIETMGKVLLFTPFLVSLIPLLYGCYNNGPPFGPDAGFSAVLVMATGFFTLVYASIMRFKEGLRTGREKFKQ